MLECNLDSKDCLAVLLTGYGKCLSYTIAIPQQRTTGREQKNNNNRLIALME